MDVSVLPRRTTTLALVVLGLGPVQPVHAIELDDPDNFSVGRVWSGTDVGVPGRLGGMLFSDDGATLYVVGNSEAATSALYAVPVTRDPVTEDVVDLGPAESVTKVFDGSRAGLDTGLEFGPEGTVFYTYWNANDIGERPGGLTGSESIYAMDPVGVPVSVAGLTFSPHLDDTATGFGLMQVSSWQGDDLFNVPLTPVGGGLFEPGDVTLFVSLPQQGTGAIQYVPAGPLKGNLMYVNWDFGEVRMLHIDRATGLPIDDATGVPTLGTDDPRDQRFASDIGVGPWGLEFDPRSRDFFVSTWNGDPANSIIQFTGPGFDNRPPVADGQSVSARAGVPVPIVLTGSDPDEDELSFIVLDSPQHGNLSGEAPVVTYRADATYTGPDEFHFQVDDGDLRSRTATISISVTSSADTQDDGGCDCRTAPLDRKALVVFVLGMALLAGRRLGGPHSRSSVRR